VRLEPPRARTQKSGLCVGDGAWRVRSVEVPKLSPVFTNPQFFSQKTLENEMLKSRVGTKHQGGEARLGLAWSSLCRRARPRHQNTCTSAQLVASPLSRVPAVTAVPRLHSFRRCQPFVHSDLVRKSLGSWSRVQGSGFRVQGLGVRV
jgi:hypothetical protein